MPKEAIIEELSKKSVRELLKKLGEEYAIDSEFLKRIEKSYYFFKGRKKIFITSEKLDLSEIQREGIHIISIEKFGYRLSVEGSQIFGPFAKKKIVELDEKQFIECLRGKDLEIKTPYKREFVILKYKNYYLGSGLAYPNKIVNYLSKARRIFI